jgi:hypothetical protein
MFFRTACTFLLALICLATNLSASDVVDLAADLIGRPYVWGAEGPRAFDCSGLMQFVFGEVGIDLPRRAVDQSEVGDPTGRRLQRGDLVFFASDTRRSLVTHVGIYEGRGVMVNASKRHGRVRRDDLNDSYWTARYMFAKRVVRSDGRARDEAPDRDRPSPTGPEPGTGGRRETLRTLGRIAEELLRRYPR